MSTEFKGLPGIVDFLSSKGDNQPIEINELNSLTDAIIAYTGVTKKQSIRILSLFFQNIRSSMLKGDTVDIRGLGMFLISSPLTTGTRIKTFPKFKPKKSLLKRMNYVRDPK